VSINNSCSGDPAVRAARSCNLHNNRHIRALSGKSRGNSFFIPAAFLLFFSFFLVGCTQNAESILGGLNEGTLYVCTSGCDYASISPAIAAADDGDTIIVAAGTYTETLGLAGKRLTIEGAGAGLTIIDASDPSFYEPAKVGQNHSIQDFGDNSAIRGVTLIGNSASSPSHYGFKVSHVDNITLENIRVQNSYRNGIDLNAVDTATLNNIEVTGTVLGFGLLLLDSQNITVTNVTTNNNLWGGVTIQAKDASSDNVRLLGTFDASDTIPLLVEQDPPYGLISNVQIPDKFEWVAYGYRAGPDYRQWFYHETQADAVAFVNYMDTTTDFTYTGTNSYSVPVGGISHYVGLTVQEAIDVATVDDVVHVPSGTFDGVVDINKRIILQGSGSEDDGTVLTKNTPVANPAPYPLQVDGATYTYNPVVIISKLGIDGSPILLRDLKIEPRQDIIGDARQIPAILFAPGASADNYVTSYSYLELNNIRVIGTSSVGTPESGITIDGSTSVDNLVINNCEFSYMAFGIIFYNNGNFPSVVENIQVNNTVFDNNSIKGFYTEKLSYATFNDVTATDNGKTDKSPDFADKYNAGIEVNLKYGAYYNLTFNNLIVTGNGLTSDAAVTPNYGAGLTIKARGTGNDTDSDYHIVQASLTGVTISGGVFTANETGIRVGEPNRDNLYPKVISVSGATISGNNPRGLDNQIDGVTVNAPDNKWNGGASTPGAGETQGSINLLP